MEIKYIGITLPEWTSTLVNAVLNIFVQENRNPVVKSITIGSGVIKDTNIIGNHTEGVVTVDLRNIRDYCIALEWKHFRLDCQLVMELVRVLGHEFTHACGIIDEDAAIEGGRWAVGQFFKTYDLPKDLGEFTRFCGGLMITPHYCVYHTDVVMFYSLRDCVHHVEFHEEVWNPTCKRVDLDTPSVSDPALTVNTVAKVMAEAIVTAMPENLLADPIWKHKTPPAPETTPASPEGICIDEWDVPEQYTTTSEPVATTVAQTITNPPSTQTPPRPEYVVTGETQLGRAAKVLAAFDAIVLRCQKHLIEKCGWGADGTFSAAGNVVEPIYIGDIPGWEILKSIDGTGADGKTYWNKPVDGSINGFVLSPSGLPNYKLHFEVFGKKANRTLIPVNPKGPSKSSVRVAAGEKLTWIRNDDITQKEVDAIKAAGGKASIFKYQIIGEKLLCLN